MVYELINRLVSAGNGVYLTDARKYFVYDHKTSDRYANTQKAVYVDILKREIGSVKPTLCVCLGNRAGSIMYDVATENPELLIYSITLPHLSGAARGAIVKRLRTNSGDALARGTGGGDDHADVTACAKSGQRAGAVAV